MLVTEQVAQAVPGIGDLCPIVAAACLTKIPIDRINPIKSFMDSFFSASAEDTLRAVGRMVIAVPEPNFTSEWFRAIYLDMGVTWIGWMVAVLVFTFRLSAYGWRDIRYAGQITKDFMVDLLVIALLPVVLNGAQLLSSGFSEMFIAMFSVDDPDFLVALVPNGYFSVGWMSLMLRGLSLWLMLELLFIYLAMVATVVFLGMFWSLRSLGAFGDNFIAKSSMFLLLGIAAKPVMLLIIGLSLAFLPAMSKIGLGSTSFVSFGVAAFVILACAIAPIMLFKKTKQPVMRAVVRAFDSFEPKSSSGGMVAEERWARNQHYRQRQAQRREQRSQKLAIVGTAALTVIATGGTGVGAAAAMVSSKAASVKRGVDSFRTFNETRKSSRNANQPPNDG